MKPGERRVAATPDTTARLKKLGYDVAIERGAGTEAGYRDDDYVAAGAVLVDDAFADPGSEVHIVCKVNPPTTDEIARAPAKTVLISLLFPDSNAPTVEALAKAGLTALALDKIPRISRAQKMDVLSSMANIAGYRAVIEAANAMPRFFGGQITAAGKTPPATVLVIGAGVAGLSAIGAARGLGAEVWAFDTREPVRQQVESMGGRFLTVEIEESGEGQGGYAKQMSAAFIEAEMALFRDKAPKVDIVITTALIPGKPAPKLWMADMVAAMKPGSVVVDLAAAQGGNCELTQPGEAVDCDGVTVIGYTDLTSRLAGHASQLFARNVVHLLDDMTPLQKVEGEDKAEDKAEDKVEEKVRAFRIDRDDVCVRGALVVADGEILPPPPPPDPSPPKPPPQDGPSEAKPAAPPTAPAPIVASKHGGHGGETQPASSATVATIGLASAIGAVALGQFAPGEFIGHFTVFVLSVLIGWQVIWNVTPALHTPLMSVTNAISGIILVGGMIGAGSGSVDLAAVLGAVAILLAAINVFGGFLVTQRMLQMFRK